MIRKANESDLEAIFELVKIFSTSFQPERLCFTHSFNLILRDEFASLFVTEHNNEVIGYSLGFIHDTFYANGKVAWLEEIIVRDDFRRKGVGSKLINFFEQDSKNKGCKLIALATRRASDFYIAIGFEESATYFRKTL